MENLPKDIQREIALNLSPPEIIRFCLTSKSFNKEICESKDFWRQKISIDYPKLFLYHQKNDLPLQNPKSTYMRKFTQISKTIEDFIAENGPRKYSFDEIYKIYTDSVKNPEKTLEHSLAINHLISKLKSIDKIYN